jgi:hypothetical protein
MSDECKHPYVFTFDSIPPIHTCTDCGEILPLTEQDKRDYRDYTGHDYTGHDYGDPS